MVEMNPELLEVPRADAVAYAEQVLSCSWMYLTGWLRDRIDLSVGTFGVTRDYFLSDDGEWSDTGGRDLNSIPDPTGTWPPGNLTTAIGRFVSPRLTAGRVLVVGNSFHFEREEHPPRDDDVVFVQCRRGERYESFLLLPGPVRRAAGLKVTVGHAVGASAAVGVISNAGGVELPTFGAEVTGEELQSLLGKPEVVFMRMGSYDGFLVWTRSGP